MRIVLDSNVLLVAVSKRGNYRAIWDAFVEGNYQLVVSDEILYEYEEILKLHSAPGVSEIITEILIESPDVVFQNVYYNWNAIKNDPDDDKFFDVAFASNADYLVTNDAHFNVVKDLHFPSVNIISASGFIDVLRNA